MTVASVKYIWIVILTKQIYAQRNNRATRKWYEISSKLTTKTPEQRQSR